MWPLCPRPRPLECLTSWLYRLASPYRLTPTEFLRESGILESDGVLPAQLNIFAPDWLLEKLAQFSGLPAKRLQPTTLASFISVLRRHAGVPPSRGASFASYVCGYRVFPEVEDPDPSNIRTPRLPWIRQGGEVDRVCPECLLIDEVTYLRLTWTTGLTTTCPVHGLKLVPVRPPHAHQVVRSWLSSTAEPSAELLELDALTSQALMHGHVQLSAGRKIISAGTWLRFLRAFIDELARGEDHHQWGFICSPEYARVWKAMGLEPPSKTLPYLSFEDSSDVHRYALFRAAAIGVAMLRRGELVPREGSQAGDIFSGH